MPRPRILLITKGHPFERDAFFSMFDTLDIHWTHVEQPAAQTFFNPEQARDYDAFVLYDMPGIEFGATGPDFVEPTPQFQEGFLSLLDSGFGIVFLHHALAGWPAWEEYAEIVGGRFLYLPDTLRGKARQDSGYRHGVEHSVQKLIDHPVTRNLPQQFKMTDELYLAEIFEEDVIPLLRSDYSFIRDNFYSATQAVKDRKMYSNENWEHEDGSNLVAWAKSYKNSPLVYIQGGDSPEAYADINYQRLIVDAIKWVSSTEGLNWARASKK